MTSTYLPRHPVHTGKHLRFDKREFGFSDCPVCKRKSTSRGTKDSVRNTRGRTCRDLCREKHAGNKLAPILLFAIKVNVGGWTISDGSHCWEGVPKSSLSSSHCKEPAPLHCSNELSGAFLWSHLLWVPAQGYCTQCPLVVQCENLDACSGMLHSDTLWFNGKIEKLGWGGL